MTWIRALLLLLLVPTLSACIPIGVRGSTMPLASHAKPLIDRACQETNELE